VSKFRFITELVLAQAISTTAMVEGASSTSCLLRLMADTEEVGPPTKVRFTNQLFFTTFFNAVTVVCGIFAKSDPSSDQSCKNRIFVFAPSANNHLQKHNYLYNF
jgi:hypothetical protein